MENIMGGVMSKILANTIFVAVSCGLMSIGSLAYGRESIIVTATLLKQDDGVLKKYVMESMADDIKQAKKAGKMLAHAMGGVSIYAYDSIPWLFFDNLQSINDIFGRLCNDACVRYIQDGKCEYIKNIQRKRPRINKSQLGEFLHRRIINALNISDDDKKILNAEPAKTDEYVQKGIISKNDYMFYNLLNLILQYYLEKEYGKHR